MCTELGGDGMRRRVILAEKENSGGFAKPEGEVLLHTGDIEFSDVYPVLDGVDVYVLNNRETSNWLGLKKYDASMQLIEELTWKSKTRLMPEECSYFQARMCHYTGNQGVYATWL